MLKSIFSIAFPLFFVFLHCIPGRVNGEKTVFATDRDVYIAGDRLYFSLLLTDPSGNTSDYGYITLAGPAGNHICNGFLSFDRNRTNGSIYLADTLTTGVYQLITFTNCMRNESAYARKNILIINRFDKQYSNFFENVPIEIRESAFPGLVSSIRPEINLAKSAFSQREKFTVILKVPDSETTKAFSLSVRQKAPVSFSLPEENVKTMPLANQCYYLPEKTGIVLQGKLLDENKKPAENVQVFLSCVDTMANLQHALTGSGGLFRFFLNPYYFGKTIAIKSVNSFKGIIEIDNKYSSIPASTLKGIAISGDISQYIENSQKYLTIQKSYKNNWLKEVNPSSMGSGYLPLVYDVAPYVIYPADFTYLPDFMEISREIIPFLKTRGNKDGYVASVINLNMKEYTSTYIFVDGILIEDVNQIINFDSKILQKIEVIPYTRFIGKLTIPSIVSVITATRETDKLPWKYPVVKFITDSVMFRSSFIPPDPETLSRSIPDYRQLLLWEPSLDFRNQNTVAIETCTSDCTGEFEIVLTCTGDHEKAIEYKRNFYVNRK
jgi:hypothetical protein